jgi:hypothetical protein
LRRHDQAYKHISRRVAHAPAIVVGEMATIRFVYKGLQNSPASGAINATGADAGSPSELKPVKVDRWWRESSFDLWQGLEVREDPPDTMPAQWLDEDTPDEKPRS